jgi:hypothetical protein
MTAPKTLRAAGKALWRDITAEHDALDAGQRATLEAACKMRDRMDQLREVADSGDPKWLRQERDAALAMTRLLAAMRLPDDAGKRPQARQLRGVQKPSAVTSLDRARARASA